MEFEQVFSAADFVPVKPKYGDDAAKEVFKRVKKRVPLIQKSLAVVIASFQGEQVVVELKNDIEITGIVGETDMNMNVTLHQARQVCPNGSALNIDMILVNGSTIRYVHLPKDIKVVSHLSKYIRQMEAKDGKRRVINDKRSKNVGLF